MEEEGSAGARAAVIGRERELAIVRAFVDPPTWPRVLLLEGDAGIGKTTIWAEAGAAAVDAGISVLSCRLAAREVALAFGGLVDLFDGVTDVALGPLPEPQRHALAVALRRAGPDATLPDPLSVFAGVRAALANLASARPVLIAIDDVQWLDASTGAALAYVIRRLAGERIGFLLARRSGEAAAEVLDVRSEGVEVTSIEVGPLSLSSVHHLIRSRTGRVLPRPTLHRILEASGGNPLHALGIAQAFVDAGVPDELSGALPAPGTLLELVGRQVRRLPADVREALLAVATISQPTERLVAEIVGREVAGSLEAARDAGILEAGGELRFAHPLYAQCVLRTADQARRRTMHARVAELADSVEERARHLALAGVPPDDAVADALEAGAEEALGRGALRAAAELLVDAHHFTSGAAAGKRDIRAFRAAELSVLAGDRSAAGDILRELYAAVASPLRERAAGLWAEILINQGAEAEAEALLKEARIATRDPAVAARLELDLSYLGLLRLDLASAETAAERAVDAAGRTGDRALLAEAVGYRGLARMVGGRTVDEASLALALENEDRGRPPYLGLPPSGVVGLIRALSADHEAGRARFAEARAALDAIGDDCDLAHVLLWWSWLELRAGTLDEAKDLAAQAAIVAETTGSELLRAWSSAQGALVEATRGDVESSVALAADAERHGPASGLVALWLVAARVLRGLAEGDPAAVVALRGVGALSGLPRDLAEPVLGFFLPDAAEALARAGLVDEAEVLLAPFETAARRRQRPWATAAALRARAAILAERRSIDEAIAALHQALVLHEDVDMPVERARVLLQLGQLQRRTGERRAARASLQAATGAFTDASAHGWARRARDELARIPGRRGAMHELTPAELRVAELSATGRTNKEVAAQLFVSPKTVEANLGRVYRKLGIATRAELGAWLSRTAREDGAA